MRGNSNSNSHNLTPHDLTFFKLHMLVQNPRLNTCYDFHKWAWLNASVAPPRKLRKISPAIQIVLEE